MEYRDLLYERVGRIARISLNRPRYKNAQSLRLLEELDDAFTRAAEDVEVRVIVLRGEGDVFSSGHDLGTEEHRVDRLSRPYGSPDTGFHGRMRMNWREFEMFMRWRELPKPTIAAVQGFAIFNGWLLASAMDLVFAADDALFLPPKNTAFWDMGARKSKEMRFRMHPMTAQEMLDIGFLTRAVPAAELDRAVMTFAEEIAEGDPHTLWMAKRSANAVDDERGFLTFARQAFALYWAEEAGIPQTGDYRTGGRIRSGTVQAAFERGGNPEAEPK